MGSGERFTLTRSRALALTRHDAAGFPLTLTLSMNRNGRNPPLPLPRGNSRSPAPLPPEGPGVGSWKRFIPSWSRNRRVWSALACQRFAVHSPNRRQRRQVAALHRRLRDCRSMRDRRLLNRNGRNPPLTPPRRGILGVRLPSHGGAGGGFGGTIHAHEIARSLSEPE